MRIDKKRGVHSRKHPSGFRVNMYVDTPGVFLDEQGREIDRRLAEEAGFDVAKLSRQAAKNRVKTTYERQLSEKFAETEQLLEGLSLEELQGLNLKRVGGQYALVDGDGNRITSILWSESEGRALYEGLTGRPWVDSGDDEDPDGEDPDDEDPDDDDSDDEEPDDDDSDDEEPDDEEPDDEEPDEDPDDEEPDEDPDGETPVDFQSFQKAELAKMLKDARVGFPSSANKAALAKLAEENRDLLEISQDNDSLV